MKLQLRNRLKAGVMALALVFTQVVVPATPAFAANNGTLKVHEFGTAPNTESNDPKVCKFNFEGYEFDAGQSGMISVTPQGGDSTITDTVMVPFGPASNDGYAETAYVNNGGSLQLDNGRYKSTLYGKDTNGQYTIDLKAKSKVFRVDCAPVVTTVTAVNGSFADLCGPTFNASFTATPTVGVAYNPSVTGNTITVTARANQGYALSNPSWSQSYTDLLVACPPTDIEVTAVNGMFVDVCGDEYNLTFAPTATTGVTYIETRDGNKLTVTAQAQAGYVLSNPDWKQSQTDMLVSCPVVVTPTVCPENLPLIRSTDKDSNGWTLKGNAEYIEMDGGIQLNVPGAWVSSHISRDMVGPLADIGSTVEFEANPSQYVGIHIKTTDGRFLTYEYGPGYDNRWWSTSSFGVASDQGYATMDTLENIVAANPEVMTSKLYVLYTHPEASSSIIKSVTVGCTEYVFSSTGGSGDDGDDDTDETPVTPVVPSTPVTPSVPTLPVGGRGALTPAELPMTGQNGSILFTWIALLAAILTYGSVYYLQPKKRFEQ